MKLAEKFVTAALVVALLLAVLGLILSNKLVTFIAMGILIAVAATFAVLQVIAYLNIPVGEKGTQQLVIMIVAVVVCLIIISLSILTFAGKLFPTLSK